MLWTWNISINQSKEKGLDLGPKTTKNDARTCFTSLYESKTTFKICLYINKYQTHNLDVASTILYRYKEHCPTWASHVVHVRMNV